MKRSTFQAVLWAATLFRLAPHSLAAEASQERVQVIQTSRGGAETKIDVRVAVRSEAEMPSGISTFGGGHGNGRTHRAITRFSITFLGRQLPALPVRAYRDLLNPKLAESPTWLPQHDTFELHFPGGSGEKFYEVTFTWEPKSRELSRLVERRSFGLWTSKWRLRGKEWRTLSLGVHQPEDE